jgi:predicted lysophospholipase L1 biosynthesis ABC-type transport system permease subunit
LLRDAGQLLGGDAVVVSDQPTPVAFIKQAKTLGLKAVTTLSFPTMARGETSAEDSSAGKSRLIALKVVDDGYPLRGQLKYATSDGSETVNTEQGIKAPITQEVFSKLTKCPHLSGEALKIIDTLRAQFVSVPNAAAAAALTHSTV